MVRSVKKGPYVDSTLLTKVERINELSLKSVVKTWSRSSIIVPIIIGHTISVYNGREHLSVFVTDQIVGHKLGEFSPTRSFRGHIKLDKKSGRLQLIFLFFIMGQKVHPVGIRLGITKKACSHWYAKGRDYSFFLAEDKFLRDYVSQFCRQCMISKIEIERRKVGVRLRISIAQVELFVGSDGKALETLCQKLQQKCWFFRSDYIQHFSFLKFNSEIGSRPNVQIFIRQLRFPEADSQCLTDFVVFELEKRVPFRRVIRIAKERAQNLGQVLGLRIQASGRLNGAEIARTEWVREGRVPLHTFSVDLDYAHKVARTAHGLLGIKIWIFRSAELGCILDLYSIINCFFLFIYAQSEAY
jgi:small subunit ribosomal protein S3